MPICIKIWYVVENKIPNRVFCLLFVIQCFGPFLPIFLVCLVCSWNVGTKLLKGNKSSEDISDLNFVADNPIKQLSGFREQWQNNLYLKVKFQLSETKKKKNINKTYILLMTFHVWKVLLMNDCSKTMIVCWDNNDQVWLKK